MEIKNFSKDKMGSFLTKLPTFLSKEVDYCFGFLKIP
ncbi:hypothetical protein Dtox_1785 [Desulfofarcimen acetoxidans DSM 771]|jgi:hypothetical protein|uniref:Uncharacterized protein n=1 Tax=Desulfofarcimen acetoxidans (strain ATCC 49208 / DSM 771 / KCTC 5769 / VKM B-1644 / 5575) TaxID=485916 RepID=C8VX62_DESAS|nr:hypothetical protein Dtox_1785 [Desulfofarcimen acetoxidans DSM 771]